MQMVLLAAQAVVGMAAMVPDDENAHAVAYNSIQEVIGETFEVRPPEVRFEEMVSLRPSGGVQNQAPQFAIEILRQLRVISPLVIIHDRIHIGTDMPMQDELHDLRRCSMCESRSLRVIV